MKRSLNKLHLDQLLLSINEEVAELPGPVLRKLAPVLAEAERELERDLARWLKKKDGAERFTAQKLRTALLEVRDAMKGADRAGRALSEGLGTGARLASEVSQRHLAREVAEMSRRFEGSIAPLPIKEATNILRGTLLDRYAEQGSRWSKGVRDDLRRQLAISVVRGETVDEATRRIAGKVVNVAGGIAQKTWKKASFDARRIMRTEVVSAYNQAKAEQLAELSKGDDKLVMLWNAAIDRRTCEDCRALDGKTAAAGELFPGGVEAPPLHPFLSLLSRRVAAPRLVPSISRHGQ